MSEVAYAAAVVLAGLFAWAGVAKLGARRRTTRTFRALGLPSPSALAVAVPVVELGLAVALLVAPRAGAAGALVVLVAFTAFLARAVARGTDVGCGCFGSASAERVSAVDLLRNALLAAAAVVALGAPAPDLPGTAAVVATGAAVGIAALVLALAALKRDVGHVLHMDLPHS
jgi:uncharacterized membrane protein YphA (DoxX/SURF4 family)